MNQYELMKCYIESLGGEAIAPASAPFLDAMFEWGKKHGLVSNAKRTSHSTNLAKKLIEVGVLETDDLLMSGNLRPNSVVRLTGMAVPEIFPVDINSFTQAWKLCKNYGIGTLKEREHIKRYKDARNDQPEYTNMTALIANARSHQPNGVFGFPFSSYGRPGILQATHTVDVGFMSGYHAGDILILPVDVNWCHGTLADSKSGDLVIRPVPGKLGTFMIEVPESHGLALQKRLFHGETFTIEGTDLYKYHVQHGLYIREVFKRLWKQMVSVRMIEEAADLRVVINS